jgi:hypothetical protein
MSAGSLGDAKAGMQQQTRAHVVRGWWGVHSH